MNTIVMNTLNGAVTEYSNFDFQSITPTHAGAATGLFLLGADKDLTQPIVATIKTGTPLWGSTLKKMLAMIYLALKASGTFRLTVHGEKATFPAYSFSVNSQGVSRCKPGKGIRENYLAFSLTNPAGQAFRLDRIEVDADESKQRRTA